MTERSLLQVCRLGQVFYRPTWSLQARLAEVRKRRLIPDTLLLLEHHPVITYGRNVGPGSLLHSEDDLKARGVELVEVDRGGDATFHGPGQLIAYPILDLREDRPDVRYYVWRLEEVMIKVMAKYGVTGSRSEGAPGAWVLAQDDHEIDRKMGALGVRLSRWVTHHGVGFNLITDLSYFNLIIPCGLQNKGVTSLQKEINRQDPSFCLDFHEVEEHFVNQFGDLFPRRVIEITSEELMHQLSTAETQLR